MTIRKLDHVGIVFDDLDAATEFFLDLGLEKQGSMSMQSEMLDNIVGLEDVRSDVVYVRTPDGGGALELIKFHSHPDDQDPQDAPASRLGLRHLAFVVDDLNGIVARLHAKGYGLVGKVQDSEDAFRLCYIRGPEGVIVELAQPLQ